MLQRDGVPDNIKSFYKFNHIWRFRYDRPFHKGTKDKENEFKVRRIIIKKKGSLEGELNSSSYRKHTTAERTVSRSCTVDVVLHVHNNWRFGLEMSS